MNVDVLDDYTGIDSFAALIAKVTSKHEEKPCLALRACLVRGLKYPGIIIPRIIYLTWEVG